MGHHSGKPPTHFEQIPVHAIPRGRRRVLLVDADLDSRLMYATCLTKFGYEVDEAQDGSEALAKIVVRRPDVVVTETRLPFMGGAELCRLMRADPLTCTVPIVVVSSDVFSSSLAAVRAAGPDKVLLKPCLPDVLEAEIREVLARCARGRGRRR